MVNYTWKDGVKVYEEERFVEREPEARQAREAMEARLAKKKRKVRPIHSAYFDRA